jgi:hypothetical protein
MTSAERGLYAYCVIDGEQAPASRAGVDERYCTSVLRDEELGAVVSEVALSEFSEEALKERLEDMTFLEHTARAHDEVAFDAHAIDAACPLPMCTIFSGPDSVRDMLARDRERLRSALERIRGHDEWSVKLLGDRRMLAAGSERSAVRSSSPGHAFFERKRAQQARERSVADALGDTASELHRSLAAQAADSRLLKPQNRAISGHTGEMALNATYLVARESSERFAACAQSFAASKGDGALKVVLSGPFAPYSFVGSPAP